MDSVIKDRRSIKWPCYAGNSSRNGLHSHSKRDLRHEVKLEKNLEQPSLRKHPFLHALRRWERAKRPSGDNRVHNFRQRRAERERSQLTLPMLLLQSIISISPPKIRVPLTLICTKTLKTPRSVAHITLPLGYPPFCRLNINLT